MDSDEEAGGADKEHELYLLIAKFLEAGPCKKAADALKKEIDENKLVPPRIDWLGNSHERTLEQLMSRNKHISHTHLPRICGRFRRLLENTIPPSVRGVKSLLGAGKLSLLRTEDDAKYTQWKSSVNCVLRHGQPLLQPHNLRYPPNLCHVLQGREFSGADRLSNLLPITMYDHHMSMHIRVVGHLSAVYCIVFDKTGQYIFTGADDGLIKIWGTKDCRLLSTLRGHSGEVADMAVNHDNTILASGSCDKTIRIWCLRTGAQIAVLHGHNGSVTSVQFCPLVRGGTRYLVSTGGDACVCFWQYSNDGTCKFELKPIKFTERSRSGAQMLCSSFSAGGVFLATGSTDQSIRVYSLLSLTPEKISEVDPHTDRVDSIQFSNNGDRFMSGSRDGTARIWKYARQEWHFMTLDMSTTLTKTNTDEQKKFRVTMVRWSHDDTYVITAVSDTSIKLWNSYTGALLQVMQGHDDEVFVIEINPADNRIILTAGHDGKINLWSIPDGKLVRTFINTIPGQGQGAVFDCKFSPDGQTFAATDSHGHLLIFGMGSSEPYMKVPQEQFFHTDYRPLIRDSNGFVLDEQTQQAPHLMPPPFLVDVDGCPHPIQYQRLVPGREDCKDSQLIPQIGTAENGDRQVVGDNFNPDLGELVPVLGNDNVNHNELDAAIANLRQGNDNRVNMQHDQDFAPVPQLGSPDRLAGVRRASGNVPVSRVATNQDILAWSKRRIVRQLDQTTLKRCEAQRIAYADAELARYVRERKQKPLPISRSDSSDGGYNIKTRRKKKSRQRDSQLADTAVNRLVTRALYDTEVEEESSSTDIQIEDAELEREVMYSSEDRGDSSDYSDWMADAQVNLQPPLRTSKRTRKKPRFAALLSDSDDNSIASVETRNSTQRPVRKRTQTQKRRALSSPEPDDEQKQPQEEPSTSKPDKKRGRPKRGIKDYNNIKELPPEFLPTEWLTAVIPRKAPYVPQMGDEVVYLRQGHQMYIDAVIRTKLYKLDPNKGVPYRRNTNMRSVEYVKVIGIKYDVVPPRLCCLKLCYINPMTGNLLKESFTIKYHDMPDVLDFLILRQTFDQANERHWKVGDRFCSIIDDAWWMGSIEKEEPLDSQFPDSPFQCFHVAWDNGESELMSPWDLEPLEDQRIPSEKGSSKPVSQEDHLALVYKPRESDWPPCGRDVECDRIVSGLESIMQLSIAEPFLAPVDLNSYPIYAMVIEYLVDLTSIKNRLENRYYRRVSALQFDVRYIEMNARKFNETGSEIITRAKAITKLILEFIRQTDCADPMPLFQEMKKEGEAGSDSDTEIETGTASDNNETGRKRSRAESGSSPTRKRARSQGYVVTSDSWKEQSRQLLHAVMEMDDSRPFREPVDTEIYPYYPDVISEPMDLGTVLTKLEAGDYPDPTELQRDLRLIFKNSKAFNNKKSKIYTMTLRLSAHIEEKFRNVLSDWKSAVRCEKSASRSSPRRIKPHSAHNNAIIITARPSTSSVPSEPQPSTSRDISHGMAGKPRTRSAGILPSEAVEAIGSSSDEETEEDTPAHSDSATELEHPNESPEVVWGKRKKRQLTPRKRKAPTRRKRRKRKQSSHESSDSEQDADDSEEEEEAETEEDSSTSESGDSDSEDEPKNRKSRPKRRGRTNGITANGNGSDVSPPPRPKRNVRKRIRTMPDSDEELRTSSRRRGNPTPRYRETDSEDENDDVISSVSSRGRVIKPTARARSANLAL